MPVIDDIFAATTRPGKELFFGKGDPDDIRMGEFVTYNKKDFGKSKFVLIGSPQDKGVVRNNGRRGAAKAPPAVRKELYKFPVPGNLQPGDFFDAGDVITLGNLEEIHSLQYEIVGRLLDAGKIVISVGGGNDISYPDCKALAEKRKDLLVFNIDSHYDVRASGERNSGTPYRQLLDEGLINPKKFIQAANKDLVNSPKYRDFLESKSVKVFPLNEIRNKDLNKFFSEIIAGSTHNGIFWGFDIDSVRSNDAPGASATYPVGLTAEEICEIASVAGASFNNGIFEITEVNPEYDIDNRTSKLAAMMIIYFLRNIRTTSETGG